ncbi:MAG: GWxTD domain-containing protein [Bacteroidetes bacterium]|nr:GWxTD domain-containing protein [Bacteroidota bacterium]
MSKKIFLFILVFVSTVFSQRNFNRSDGKRPEFNLRKPVLIESNIVPSDLGFVCYFTYKIPFNNILFLKDGDNFTGGISFTIEVHKDDVYLKSETVNNKISVIDYNLTNSESDYLEGLLKVNLNEGKYLIRPALKIDNLNKDILIKPFPLLVDSLKSNSVLSPVVVYNQKLNSQDEYYFRLFNSEGIVPYSVSDFNIVIPAIDTSLTEIKAVIKQNDIEIVNKILQPVETIGFDIAQIDNSVCIVDNKENGKIKLFLLTEFSTKLKEGNALLTIEANGKKQEFDLVVGWPDKPKTLSNPEFAIKILEHITPGPELDNLTDGDEEDYYDNLIKYWKQFDQNKATAFNEVMNEFYQRADYAVKEFSTPSNRDGTNSDRGRIYVKYGKPDEIERSYSEKDNTIEIWIYENIGKRFVFSDKNGLGNFTLLK